MREKRRLAEVVVSFVSREIPMQSNTSLYDRVVAEGALGDAFKSAFDAPEEHGGPKPKKKQPKKRRRPWLLRTIKDAATKTARTLISPVVREEDVSLHGRVFMEAKKPKKDKKKKKSFLDTVREYADVSDPSHPWNKIMVKAGQWSDAGGALNVDPDKKKQGGSGKSSDSQKSAEEKPWEATKKALKIDVSPKSETGASVALRSVKKATRDDRFERDRVAQSGRRVGQNQPGSQTSANLRRQIQVRKRSRS